jgi:hypothetical protein
MKATIKGGDTQMRIAEDYNLTYNLAKLIRKACDWEDFTIGEFKAGQVLDKISKGIFELTTNQNDYIQLLPFNGWGTFADTANFLKWLQENLSSFSTEELDYILIEIR